MPVASRALCAVGLCVERGDMHRYLGRVLALLRLEDRYAYIAITASQDKYLGTLTVRSAAVLAGAGAAWAGVLAAPSATDPVDAAARIPAVPALAP